MPARFGVGPRDDCLRSLDLSLASLSLLIHAAGRVNDATKVLHAIGKGEAGAEKDLLPLVYDELRKLAAHKLAGEQPGQTLQPTALVHEAWLRLVGKDNPSFDGRGHFFAAAAEAMRRILIDRAREKTSLKRGADAVRLNLDEIDVAIHTNDDALLAVNEAMEKLAVEDAESAKLVELRFFAGLTTEEAAIALGISERTVRNRWAYARAWLCRELQRQGM